MVIYMKSKIKNLERKWVGVRWMIDTKILIMTQEALGHPAI